MAGLGDIIQKHEAEVAKEAATDEQTTETTEVVDESQEQETAVATETEEQQQVEETAQAEVSADENKESVEEEAQVTETVTDGSSFTFGDDNVTSETETESQQQESEKPVFTDEDVFSRISEMLGNEVKSVEDLKSKQQESNPWLEDPEIAKFIEFKEKTKGKSFNEFALYQSIDTSEMDNMSAVRLEMQMEYPDLNGQDIQELIDSKYKLDEDEYDESEVKRAKIMLKADGSKAKKKLETLRQDFLIPKQEETQATSPQQQTESQEEESVFDDAWKSDMRKTVDGLNALQFKVEGSDDPFNVSISNEMKQQVKSLNESPENFFDRYIDQNDNWNHKLFNAERFVIENLSTIINQAVKHGMGLGQKEIVETASNASAVSTSEQGGTTENKIMQQQAQDILRRIGGGAPKMTIGG